jgi:protein-S-isoprenylcysteine O-methyltransferase Ste14
VLAAFVPMRDTPAIPSTGIIEGMRRSRAALGSAGFTASAPGTTAVLVPWLLTRWHSSGPPGALVAFGALLFTIGAGVGFQGVAHFVLEGRGTPLPIAPPERLVLGGLYRHVRNPMYLGVISMIVGQALLLGRPVLFAYAGTFWLVVAVFVRLFEEPTLSRRFGDEYAAYRQAVRAWWPRVHGWSPDTSSA